MFSIRLKYREASRLASDQHKSSRNTVKWLLRPRTYSDLKGKLEVKDG